MSRDDKDEKISQRSVGEQQMALMTQLGQSILTMHHIDEVFQWLAYAIVQHFNVQLVQFWTNQIGQSGRLVTQLRTVVRRDPSVPEQIVVNDYVAYIAQRVTSERRSYQPQPIENLFPSYQSGLLKRYGLNYCGACFLSKNILLPPAENMFSSERFPVPLAMTTLFIIRHFPHPDIMPSIAMVLEQAMIMAGNRNLLLPNRSHAPYDFPGLPPAQTPLPHTEYDFRGQLPAQTPLPYTQQDFPGQLPAQTPLPRSEYDFSGETPDQIPLPRSTYDSMGQPSASAQIPLPLYDFRGPPSGPIPSLQPPQKVFTLEQLIPHRKQDADLFLTDNPFASGAMISDKKARRLNAVIDGRSSIADLYAATGMNSKEAYLALQLLLNQQRIELYTPDGKPTTLPPLTK